MNPYHDTLIAAGWDPTRDAEGSLYQQGAVQLRKSSRVWAASVQVFPAHFENMAWVRTTGKDPANALHRLWHALVGMPAFMDNQDSVINAVYSMTDLRPLPPGHGQLLSKGWVPHRSGEDHRYARKGVSLRFCDLGWYALAVDAGLTVGPERDADQAVASMKDALIKLVGKEFSNGGPSHWGFASRVLEIATGFD